MMYSEYIREIVEMINLFISMKKINSGQLKQQQTNRIIFRKTQKSPDI